ncbi:MAG TPA: hypothetical protein VMC81_11570 [Rhodocyclaceae bacterium]|nr:hypothetical protein [Rhodocyclaceae bacterium]
MKISGILLVLLLGALAGCATKEAPVAARPAPTPAQPAAKPPAEEPEVYSRLAGRKIKPNAVRPLNAKADCSFRDPNGYGGRLNLAVEDSQVQRLQADLEVPGRGRCSFALKDFRQTAREPSVTLSALTSKCVVRLWEQEGQVTVAFNTCRERCQSDAFDYIWPIKVDPKTGTCS